MLVGKCVCFTKQKSEDLKPVQENNAEVKINHDFI